jgi:hypothetical protein
MTADNSPETTEQGIKTGPLFQHRETGDLYGPEGLMIFLAANPTNYEHVDYIGEWPLDEDEFREAVQSLKPNVDGEPNFHSVADIDPQGNPILPNQKQGNK